MPGIGFRDESVVRKALRSLRERTQDRARGAEGSRAFGDVAGVLVGRWPLLNLDADEQHPVGIQDVDVDLAGGVVDWMCDDAATGRGERGGGSRGTAPTILRVTLMNRSTVVASSASGTTAPADTRAALRCSSWHRNASPRRCTKATSAAIASSWVSAASHPTRASARGPDFGLKGAKTLVCLGTSASQLPLRGSRDGLVGRLPALRVAAEVAASQRPTRRRQAMAAMVGAGARADRRPAVRACSDCLHRGPPRE